MAALQPELSAAPQTPPSIRLALVKVILLSRIIAAEVISTPRAVMLWMVPPDPLVVPVPVTVRPPVEPVVFSTMPLAGSAAAVLLPAEMLRKFRSPAPMVVFATFSAMADVLLRVLPAPVTWIVPPPVAVKPVPVLLAITSPPLLKLMVAPALLLRLTAVLAPVLRFLLGLSKAMVPPLEFCTRMPCVVDVMLPV